MKAKGMGTRRIGIDVHTCPFPCLGILGREHIADGNFSPRSASFPTRFVGRKLFSRIRSFKGKFSVSAEKFTSLFPMGAKQTRPIVFVSRKSLLAARSRWGLHQCCAGY